MPIDLEGELYFVRFDILQGSRKTSSRGDHGMGGGERTVYYWRGNVTVSTSADMRVLAVCDCVRGESYSRERDYKKLIFSPQLLPEREEQFADFMGRRIISIFETHRSRDAPSFQLQPPDDDALIEAGLAVGYDEQLNAPLETNTALEA